MTAALCAKAVLRDDGAYHSVHWYLASVTWHPARTACTRNSVKTAVHWSSGTAVVCMIEMDLFLSGNDSFTAIL